jgi:hypothetical protein
MSKHLSQHFSPRASLCALGPKIRSLRLLETLSKQVFIKQKTIKHTPVEKLYDAFIAILAVDAMGRVGCGGRLKLKLTYEQGDPEARWSIIRSSTF